jgi:hypothetical protein
VAANFAARASTLGKHSRPFIVPSGGWTGEGNTQIGKRVKSRCYRLNAADEVSNRTPWNAAFVAPEDAGVGDTARTPQIIESLNVVAVVRNQDAPITQRVAELFFIRDTLVCATNLVN